MKAPDLGEARCNRRKPRAAQNNSGSRPVRRGSRRDTPSNAPGHQFRDQDAAPDRPGPACSIRPLADGLESGAGRNRARRRPAPPGGGPCRFASSSARAISCMADAALAERRLDRQRAEQQRPAPSPIRIGDSRTEPTSSVPTRAVNDSSGLCADLLAQPVGRLGEPARPEGARVQPLDRGARRPALSGQDGEGKVVHRFVIGAGSGRLASVPAAGPSAVAEDRRTPYIRARNAESVMGLPGRRRVARRQLRRRAGCRTAASTGPPPNSATGSRPTAARAPPAIGGFPAEPGRYHLYVSLACPWAHRTIIFRQLKRLESVDLDVGDLVAHGRERLDLRHRRRARAATR